MSRQRSTTNTTATHHQTTLFHAMGDDPSQTLLFDASVAGVASREEEEREEDKTHWQDLFDQARELGEIEEMESFEIEK